MVKRLIRMFKGEHPAEVLEATVLDAEAQPGYALSMDSRCLGAARPLKTHPFIAGVPVCCSSTFPSVWPHKVLEFLFWHWSL